MKDAGHTGDAAAPARRSLFFAVFPSIMLPMFLAVIDQTIVATALPAIAASLGEVERVSWVVISYRARVSDNRLHDTTQCTRKKPIPA
jgi:hypothetical protein